MSVNMIAASLRCSVPSLIASPETLQTSFVPPARWVWLPDRKSTRLNSSHSQISYAVFCLKKKNNYYSDKTTCYDLVGCSTGHRKRTDPAPQPSLLCKETCQHGTCCDGYCRPHPRNH